MGTPLPLSQEVQELWKMCFLAAEARQVFCRCRDAFRATTCPSVQPQKKQAFCGQPLVVSYVLLRLPWAPSCLSFASLLSVWNPTRLSHLAVLFPKTSASVSTRTQSALVCRPPPRILLISQSGALWRPEVCVEQHSKLLAETYAALGCDPLWLGLQMVTTPSSIDLILDVMTLLGLGCYCWKQ